MIDLAQKLQSHPKFPGWQQGMVAIDHRAESWVFGGYTGGRQQWSCAKPGEFKQYALDPEFHRNDPRTIDLDAPANHGWLLRWFGDCDLYCFGDGTACVGAGMHVPLGEAIALALIAKWNTEVAADTALSEVQCLACGADFAVLGQAKCCPTCGEGRFRARPQTDTELESEPK